MTALILVTLETVVTIGTAVILVTLETVVTIGTVVTVVTVVTLMRKYIVRKENKL